MGALQDRIATALGKFAGGDKVEIARDLVKILELEEGEPLAGPVAEAMGRELTEEERFKVEVLEETRRQMLLDGGFPDGIAAPKADK